MVDAKDDNRIWILYTVYHSTHTIYKALLDRRILTTVIDQQEVHHLLFSLHLFYGYALCNLTSFGSLLLKQINVLYYLYLLHLLKRILTTVS